MSEEEYLRKEIDAVEQQAAKRIDPGTGALTISIAVLALLVSLVLPWVGDTTGLNADATFDLIALRFSSAALQ